MKWNSPSVYVSSLVVGVSLLLLVSLLAYVGGYFVLRDQRGLFQSEAQFKFYEPAVRYERWVIGRPVDTGYVAPNGMRFNKRLP